MATYLTTYAIGNIVYLKTDTEQLQRIVVSIAIFPGGIQYELGCAHESSHHWEIEMSGVADESLKLGIDASQN
jgi:hypothetical protein